MPSTANRLSFFTESVIREMTRVANEYDAINLSQGFPDADPPPEVLAQEIVEQLEAALEEFRQVEISLNGTNNEVIE